jgi:hypothetical protein
MLRRSQLAQEADGDDDAGKSAMTELADRGRHAEGLSEPSDDKDGQPEEADPEHHR